MVDISSQRQKTAISGGAARSIEDIGACFVVKDGWARVRAQRTAAIWRPLLVELDFATQVAYCGINN